ncbi:MAG: Ger(x)C family spore germination protein [Firmicutes bacterium]|nr:Ger(x)C family spore germination protein [Bacillota bacterium]
MKKLLLLTLALTLFMSGCWSRVELEERIIVAAVGFDTAKDPDKIEVTAQIIMPGQLGTTDNGGGNSKEAVNVYTDTGYNVFDALRNITRQTGKKLFLAEIGVFIVGESLARKDIGSVMDFIRRDAEPNIRSWVVVVKGRAKEALETQLTVEKVWALQITKMIQAAKFNAKAPMIDILDFEKATRSATTRPVVPVMTIGQEKETSQNSMYPSRKLVLGGSAIFKDYSLVGCLDEGESRGFLWIDGEVKSGIVVVPHPGGEEQLMALEIIRASSEVKPAISNDGNMSIKIKVNEEGNIGEIRPDHIELFYPENIKMLEKAKQTVIQNEVLAAIEKAQDLNADIFGFGEAVRRKYPKEWPQYEKKWDELFPLLDVQVEVEAKIRRTGMIINPQPD